MVAEGANAMLAPPFLNTRVIGLFFAVSRSLTLHIEGIRCSYYCGWLSVRARIVSDRDGIARLT